MSALPFFCADKLRHKILDLYAMNLSQAPLGDPGHGAFFVPKIQLKSTFMLWIFLNISTMGIVPNSAQDQKIERDEGLK